MRGEFTLRDKLLGWGILVALCLGTLSEMLDRRERRGAWVQECIQELGDGEGASARAYCLDRWNMEQGESEWGSWGYE